MNGYWDWYPITRPAKAVAGAPTFRFVQLAMFALLVIAFVTSFDSGRSGVINLGYPEHFAWSFPIICDVIAAVATIIHFRCRSDRSMRRFAVSFIVVSMVASWAANAAAHLATRPPAPTWEPWAFWGWIAAVVLAAGVPPLAVPLLILLSNRFVDFETSQVKEPVAKASQIETIPETPQVSEPLTAEPEPEPEPEPEFTEPEPVTLRTLPPPAPTVVPEPVSETNVSVLPRSRRKVKRYRLTEPQIERVMRDHRCRREVAEYMLRYGVSKATYHRDVKDGVADVAAA